MDVEITVKQLIEKVQNAHFFTEQEKEEWISILPFMTNEELVEFAESVVKAEIVEQQQEEDEEIINTAVQYLASEVNSFNAKEGFKIAESINQNKEEQSLNTLISKLDDI